MARHLRSLPVPGANHGAGAGFLLLLCAAAASLVLVSVVLFACGAHRPRRRDDGEDLVRFYGSDAKYRRTASAAAGLAGAGIAVGAVVRAGEDGDVGERRGEGVGCWGCRGGDGGGCSSCGGGAACGA